MSDMKCPFCNKPLQPTLCQSDEYWCENYDCSRTSIEWVGSQKLWQELIRTRKALDVAKYAIKNIKDDMKKVKDGDDIWEIQKNLHDYCKTTLKQITALEQKDK